MLKYFPIWIYVNFCIFPRRAPEQQILDFQTQQYKVFPTLAASYATYFISETMMALYQSAYGEIMKGNTKKLGEVNVGL